MRGAVNAGLIVMLVRKLAWKLKLLDYNKCRFSKFDADKTTKRNTFPQVFSRETQSDT